MASAAIVRFTCIESLRTPWGCSLALACLSAWPLILVVAPIGIHSGTVESLAWIYELAFVGMLLGLVLGSAALGLLAPLLSRLPPGSRLACTWIALIASEVLWSALALLPVVVTGPPGGSFFIPMDARRLVSILGVSSAWGALLLGLGMPRGTTAWLAGIGAFAGAWIVGEPSFAAPSVAAMLAFPAALWLLDHRPAGAR